MPRKPIDFSNTIMYTIRSKNSIYVGSTTDYVNRKSAHKRNVYNENRKEYNYKLYKTIRENNGDWDMQPYSKYPCNDAVEQTIEEERIRQLLKADLNSQSCGTGLNRSVLGEEEYHKQYNTEYYTNNKDKILERMNQKVKCECGCILSRVNLLAHKKTKKHLKRMENK